MKKISIFTQTHLPFFLLITIIAGLILGYSFDFSILKNIIPYVVFLMIFPAMLSLKIENLFSAFKKWQIISIALISSFIINPLIALLLGSIFFPDYPDLAAGLFLLGTFAGGSLLPIWTKLAGGSLDTAIAILPINLIISSIAIPLLSSIFLAKTITIDPLLITTKIIQIVIIPLLLSMLIRYLIYQKSGETFFKEKVLSNASIVTPFTIIAMTFTSISIKAKTIISNPELFIKMFSSVFLLIISMATVGYLTSKFIQNKKDAIAIFFSIGTRNIALALGISISLFDPLASTLIASSFLIFPTVNSTLAKLIKSSKLKI